MQQVQWCVHLQHLLNVSEKNKIIREGCSNILEQPSLIDICGVPADVISLYKEIVYNVPFKANEVRPVSSETTKIRASLFSDNPIAAL